MPGIYEVTYVESLINSINKNVRQVSFILACFAAILLVTVVILINNTIKLALFSQRFLIRSMQLVGATSSFIQKPFIIRAIIHGTMAGIVSCVILAGLLTYTNNNVQDLSALQERDQILFLFVFIVLAGTFIGFFSTYYSVKKYLSMSLDDLY